MVEIFVVAKNYYCQKNSKYAHLDQERHIGVIRILVIIACDVDEHKKNQSYNSLPPKNGYQVKKNLLSYIAKSGHTKGEAVSLNCKSILL